MEPKEVVKNTAPCDSFSLDSIPYTTAKARVDRYINIYGKRGLQYLVGNNDSLLLPRYFVINSDSFHNLLKDLDGYLFASLNVKERQDVPTNPDTAVASLIFHNIKPNENGSLNGRPDHFYDYGNACPIDCGDTRNHGGYNGSKVDSAQAIQRIVRYNEIYGSSNSDVRYMKRQNVLDSVLIPRYYAFDTTDISSLLCVMERHNHEFFYVSIGAVPQLRDGKKIPHSYVSDLIFHDVRPDKEGLLIRQSQDNYYDVTRPCPDSCNYP